MTDIRDPDAAPEVAESAGGPRRSSSARAVWRAVFRGAGWGCSALVALTVLVIFVVPGVTGAQRYSIVGSSMEPTLPLGALVVVRPTDAVDIEVGEIITFQLRSGEPTVATHRVVGVALGGDGARMLRTKGDNNDAADADPVRPEQVRGVVMYSLPLLGYINAVITPQMQAWMLPIVVIGLFCYAGWMFIGAWRDRRKRGGSMSDDSRRSAPGPRHPDPGALG
ncbi:MULTISPECIES: signal peptidase I [Microbacterium]|uniref:signal peptidase I n=1 Tax=Microbacterium TaxID=33882 RepID=UPI002782AAEA|nr:MULTISPECIES: signal peptidase I [Microbacterium]MDQ1075535.1 signal peptidase [Microbacterium sp. SORGH_AS_0969]MDQ1115774.1 signal peptidase [Microbacterium testaceum]